MPVPLLHDNTTVRFSIFHLAISYVIFLQNDDNNNNYYYDDHAINDNNARSHYNVRKQTNRYFIVSLTIDDFHRTGSSCVPCQPCMPWVTLKFEVFITKQQILLSKLDAWSGGCVIHAIHATMDAKRLLQQPRCQRNFSQIANLNDHF